MKNNNVPIYAVLAPFAAACVFALSLLISPYYINGDQVFYTKAYNEIANLNLFDGYIFYSNWTGGVEFISYFLVWLASGCGIEKNLAMSVANAILAYFSMRLFKIWKVSTLVSVTFVLTNFYMLVMYFAAERLKFGMLFLVISMMYFRRRQRFFYGSAVLAIFSHVQTMLVYAAMFCVAILESIVKFFKTFKFSRNGVLLLLISLGPITYLSGYIYRKLGTYVIKLAEEDTSFGLVRITIFLILSLWYSKDKREAALLFIPIILAVFLIGGDRVNMIGYFVFLYYGLQYNRGLNFGVLATSTYFAAKSFYFVLDIIERGEGF